MNSKPKDPWYKVALVGIEVGPTGAQSGIDPEDIDFVSKFSGKEIVEKQLLANSKYLVIWAKDNEYAYYNSGVAPKAPGLGVRDILKEVVKAAKPYGLPIIAYCELQYDNHIWRTMPECRMVDVKGKEIPGRICFNSVYVDHMKQMISEIMDYGIDGFHFDMVDQGFGPPYGCWCPNCEARFKEEYGKPMPRELLSWDADWERVMEFRYNTSMRFEREIYDFVRKKNPKITVDFNYHGYPPFSWEVGQRPVQHAHIGDFVTGESGVWGFGTLHTSLLAIFMEATKPGAVYQGVIQRNVRTYHDMTVRPVADMRWEAFTLLSHGASVTVVDKTNYDGSLDYEAYRRIGEVFAEANRKREHFGQKPLREVGVYFSSRTRDWYGRVDPYLYYRAPMGAHRALVYAHIQMGIILDENVTLERIKEFPVVYLPNVAILSEREVDLFREYVASGGNLLVTGITGLYDQRGEELGHSLIEDLVGARFIKRLSSMDNYIRLFDSAKGIDVFCRDIPLQWPFLVYGQAAIFEATAATSYGELLRPHRTLQQRKREMEPVNLPLSPDIPVGPAIFVNSYGKGKVVYLPCSPDVATASEYRSAEPRLLIRNVVRYLYPNPMVEVSAPLHVESVITDDEANRLLRIHLIGYISPAVCTFPSRPQVLPSMMEEAPLYRAEIHVRCPYRDIRVLNPNTKVTATHNRIQMEIQDVHETIIVSY